MVGLQAYYPATVHKDEELIIWELWGQNALIKLWETKTILQVLGLVLGPQTRKKKPQVCWEVSSEDLGISVPEYQVIGLISMVTSCNKHTGKSLETARYRCWVLEFRGWMGSRLPSARLTLRRAHNQILGRQSKDSSKSYLGSGHISVLFQVHFAPTQRWQTYIWTHLVWS